MKTPGEVIQGLQKCIKKEWKLAFLGAVILGLLTHMPMLLMDVPNHDGLASMYFDQNMITSGRWFLTVACGASSYYTLPWLISLFALLWVGLAAAVLVEFLEVTEPVTVVVIGGLLGVFPAIASTFAYIFTMDGYMMALFLAVAAALCVKKWKWGFVPGGICLGFSLGIYQAYLPFAVILSLYGIVMLFLESKTIREKLVTAARYLYMGVLGLAFYYGMLQILLKIQGKVLASYQGINGMDSGLLAGGVSSLLTTIKDMYVDFFRFTLAGNVVCNNVYSYGALVLLYLTLITLLILLVVRKKWWKSVWFYLVLFLLAIGLPFATNLIKLISAGVTYHLLMRYQWVLYLIIPIAFVSRYGKKTDAEQEAADRKKADCGILLQWSAMLAAVVLILNYAVTDNIAYSNLQKRYEKTYAYCIRLLDRIEQTPGYYQGIPVAMIGVVGDESYPATDITGDVTGSMIGMNGDVLLYTGANYDAFIRNYLGASLNILPTEVMEEIYYSEEYRQMDSFPGADSIKIVDGVLYVKTENVDRSLAD